MRDMQLVRPVGTGVLTLALPLFAAGVAVAQVDPLTAVLPFERLEVSPSVDGYVQDMAPERNFNAPSLVLSGLSPSSVILLGYTDLLLEIDSAILQFECLIANSGYLDVYAIREPWSASTIDYFAATEVEFVNPVPWAQTYVSGKGIVTADVTPVVEYLVSNGNCGLRVSLNGSYNTLEFARGAELIITGKDIPE